MPEDTSEKPRRGRPPAGEGGRRVRDAQSILVRPTKAVYDIVDGVAEVKKWSRSHVVAEAISIYYVYYLRMQEPGVAKQVEQVLNARRKAAAPQSGA